MRKDIGLSLLLIFLIFFLPWLWGGPARETPPETPGASSSPPEPEAPEAPAEAEESQPPPEEKPSVDQASPLNVLLGGKLQQMDMQTYLLGVVRAEMPASFEEEALKAQAVAARTYVLHKIAGGGSPNHPQADACDDITCCQAYKSPEEAAGDWGERAPEYEEKVRRAVTGTDGECILYEGAPVLAVFHSSSAGTTQDAQNVWSTALPYLQSVETPEGEDTVPEYRSTASFSTAQLREKLLRALPDAKLEGSPSNWFTNIRQQSNGTVTGLSVGGVDVGGNRLRTILDLRSACFTISFEGDTVTFSVTGYGHGVGMSQYGANVMAKNGMTYREILEWYYTGTEIGVAGRTVGE